MGEWLGGLASWDVFSTLTFSRSVNLQRAMCMARQYLRWVNKAAGLPVYGFVGVEKGNMLHLHALLGNVAHLLTYCGKRLAPGVWGRVAASHMAGLVGSRACCPMTLHVGRATTWRSASRSASRSGSCSAFLVLLSLRWWGVRGVPVSIRCPSGIVLYCISPRLSHPASRDFLVGDALTLADRFPQSDVMIGAVGDRKPLTMSRTMDSHRQEPAD
jgi:hypothetical protein